MRERVFRMSSQTHLEAALRELQGFGLHAFKAHRRSTPRWLLLVVNVEAAAAAVVAVRVLISVWTRPPDRPNFENQYTGETSLALFTNVKIPALTATWVLPSGARSGPAGHRTVTAAP